MKASFTTADWLNVCARYNVAVGLAPLALLGLALLALRAIAWDWRGRDAWVRATLGVLWIWSGVVFHWAFFADVTPAARLCGPLFVAQGVAVASVGRWRRELTFAWPRRDARGVAGGLMVGAAIVFYPLVALASGRAWPALPTFGTPGPVTLFTLGLLLWAKGPVPRILVLVPVAWALLAGIGAIALELHEEWVLLFAAIVTLGLLAPSRAGNGKGRERHRARWIARHVWHHAHRE